MYKAVVFDFDGTVIDTEKHLFDLINTHLKIHQEAPISLEFYKQFIGGETTGLHTYLEDAIGFKNKEKIYDQYYHILDQYDATHLFQFLHVRPNLQVQAQHLLSNLLREQMHHLRKELL